MRNTKDPEAKVFYVYSLIDPRDGQSFYIGKGKGKRHDDHVAEWRKGKGSNHRKIARIADIHRAGLTVSVSIIAAGLNEYQAYKRERLEIASAREARQLTNLFPGTACEVERTLGEVNRNLRRFRTPEQYQAAIGRKPTNQEWGWYFESLGWFAELKARLTEEMRERYGEEIAQAKGA